MVGTALIGGGVLFAILGVVKRIQGDGKNSHSRFSSNIVMPDGIDPDTLSDINNSCGTNYQMTVDDRAAFDKDVTAEQLSEVDLKLRKMAGEDVRKVYDFGKVARFTKYILPLVMILVGLIINAV